MLIPFLYAEQLSAELQWSAVVQHVCLLDFAVRTRDAVSAGGHFCASGLELRLHFRAVSQLRGLRLHTDSFSVGF